MSLTFHGHIVCYGIRCCVSTTGSLKSCGVGSENPLRGYLAALAALGALPPVCCAALVFRAEKCWRPAHFSLRVYEELSWSFPAPVSLTSPASHQIRASATHTRCKANTLRHAHTHDLSAAACVLLRMMRSEGLSVTFRFLISITLVMNVNECQINKINLMYQNT